MNAETVINTGRDDIEPRKSLDPFTATMIVEGVYETDSLQEYVDACQTLIDTGLAWSLQGFFGRTCQRMIEEGYCTAD